MVVLKALTGWVKISSTAMLLSELLANFGMLWDVLGCVGMFLGCSGMLAEPLRRFKSAFMRM